MPRGLGVLILMTFAALYAPTAMSQTEIATTSGVVRGLDGVDAISFRGIPYAEPPLDALRWARPLLKSTEPSVILVQSPAPACTQVLGNSSSACIDDPLNAVGDVIGTEDCLTLDVWVPNAPAPAPRPVMVWIHGGGLTQGCTKNPANSPAALTQQGTNGTIVVAIQYRLGALGYFSTADLAAEDPDGSTGNYGLLDQLLALEWVQDNIAAFGGDPANVTIFGESAGAKSTCGLLATPLSDDLFDRAIAQSGSCSAEALEADPGGVVPTSGYATSGANAIDVGCAPGPGQLACLRATSSEAIVSSWASLTLDPTGTLPRANLHIDGYALDEMPSVLLHEGAADGRAAIFGSNANEMTLFTTRAALSINSPSSFDAALRAVLGDETADAILPLYPIGAFASPADAYRAAIEDLRFVCPQAHAVASLTSQGSDAYLYYFANNPSPNFNLRSFHGLELFYLFATFGTQSLFTPDAGDFALSTAMQNAWTHFAETGAPWTSPAWPLATPNSLTTPLLQWDATSASTANSVSSADAIRAGRCAALDALDLNPDLDLVWGSDDNCPLHPNSLQGDADADGIGDACEGPAVPVSSRGGISLLVAAILLPGMLALAAAPRAWQHD